MKDRELSIESIIRISGGVQMALGCEDLPSGVTTMRLGNFAEEIRKYVVGYDKAKEKERKQILKLQSELDVEKDKTWRVKHQLLDIEFNERCETLMNEMNEQKKGELIKCPEFKLSDFCAPDDFTRVISQGQGLPTQEIKIKKGQALLPPAFFTSMGDLITE